MAQLMVGEYRDANGNTSQRKIAVDADGKLLSAAAPVPISATGIAKDSQLPATLGAKPTAQSVSMTFATDIEGAGTVARPAIVRGQMTTPAASLTLRTSAYAANRVMADTQPLVGAVVENGGAGIMTSVRLIDPDAQSASMVLLFFSSNVSLGTEGSAPSITDANAMTYLGHVNVTAAHWQSLVGSSVATVSCRIGVRAAAGSKDIYVAAMSGSSTPTYPGGVIYLHATIEPEAPDASAPTPVLLGAERVLNGDGSSGSTDWTVTGSDATHTVTFAAGAIRYQSDTTSPQLVLSQNRLTAGTTYYVEMDIGPYVSGAIKFENGAFSLTANAAGKFAGTFTAANISVFITRTVANTDLTIRSISVRPVL